MIPSTPPGDWEVVYDALVADSDSQAVFDSLARLREREARWKKCWGEMHSARNRQAERAEAAEARVKELETGYEARGEIIEKLISEANALQTRVQESAHEEERGTGTAYGHGQPGWADYAGPPLAHEEEAK